MLIALKEDNTTISFYLCCLLCVLSVIIESGVICISEHLYANKCTDGMVVYMCQCMLLVTCAVTAVSVYMWIFQGNR